MATPLSCPEPCPLTPRALVSAHPLHFTFIRKPQKPTLANLLREGFSWKDIRQLTGLAGGWRTRLGTSRSQGLRTAGQCADSVPGPAPLDGRCWSFQSFQPLSEASHHSLQSQSPTEKGSTCQARVPSITLAQGRGEDEDGSPPASSTVGGGALSFLGRPSTRGRAWAPAASG